MLSSNPLRTGRRGAMLPIVAVLLIPLLALVAFAIDIGYVAMTRTQLQAAADAAALAAANEIITNMAGDPQTAARSRAVNFALAHRAGNDQVRLSPEADIEFGYWNQTAREFQAPRPAEPITQVNAVRVRARRGPGSVSGPLPLFFARVLGRDTSNVMAEAIAFAPNPVRSQRYSGIGTRFLIDEEMINDNVPSLQALARSHGQTIDQILSAKNEQSGNPELWFLNIPAGAQLEVPTGEVGDEGLLDIAANVGNPSLPQYPYTSLADHYRFLAFNETSENAHWLKVRRNMMTDSELDPVPGVGRFNQPSLYPELVNPDFIHVSPVYKSDISALDGVDTKDEKAGPDLNKDSKPDGYTTNKPVEKGVNAKGYRRGLLAFKIVGYRIDTTQPYPKLPKLIIEIVDPKTINLDTVPPVTSSTVVYKSGGVQNVRLAQ